ncbi:hypothetical protein HIM_01892 [Hirsutella minnesotensis 3608]|nr:hypothetical protein HIM_01892 [Hirsutella minnesotensis 3608]
MNQSRREGYDDLPARSIRRPTVVVIGCGSRAGIIGLSSAVRLQDQIAKTSHLRDVDILIAAREWPGSFPGAPAAYSVDYASMWAGAHVRPIPATTPQLRREAAWLRRAVAEFERQVQSEPWCGVTRTVGIEYLDEPDDGYRSQDGTVFEQESSLGHYQNIPQSELPEGVKLGFQYSTFCVNPPLYCGYLLRRFLLNGGKAIRADLKSVLEAYSLRENVLLVVNASGDGFGDDKCFPTRGQSVLTNMSIDKTFTRQFRDGTWSILIPRFFAGGTMVGGTKEPEDWRSAPDLQTRDRLLANALSVKPLVERAAAAGEADIEESPTVISDIVGRRPTRRGGMRLEVEEMTAMLPGNAEAKRQIVHAYGAGGRGYEISWGVAEEVAQLAMSLLESGSQAQFKDASADRLPSNL